MSDLPDVDIEVIDRDEVVKLFPETVPASQITGAAMVRHTSGLYFQNIPVNPLNGLAAYPYKIAEELGFYKIDLLEAPYPYDDIASMEELEDILAQPIDWAWFQNAEFCSRLFHLHNDFGDGLKVGDIIAAYAPESIPDLACLVAVKLPAKRHLVGEPWEVIRREIWKRPTDGKPWFKKSHSIAYAMVTALHARRLAPSFFGEK